MSSARQPGSIKAQPLQRRLGLPVVVLYGLGNILGAGIYVLVGKVAGFAGESTALAFLIAMIVAGLTAFSYMELAGRYPVSASVSVYLHNAFGRKWLSVGVGLAMVAGGVVSAAALAHGFAGYLNSFTPVPLLVASIALLLAIGLLAAKGIGESAIFAAILTCLEILGLLLIIWAGRSSLLEIDLAQSFTIDPAVGLIGVLGGAFLAFYAFIGFEDMVNVAEEAKNPTRTMPLAILIALIASTLLYMLVVLVAISVVDTMALSKSTAPLALVYEQSGGSITSILAGIGLIATINGVVVQVIMGSRILYGLARQKWLPAQLAHVHHRTNTPLIATALVVGLMILAVVLLPLVSLAQLTSLLVLSIFTLVNAALIVIKRRHPDHTGIIRVPIIVPLSALLCCLGLVGYQIFDWLKLIVAV